jgi:hypothetical protein
MIETIALIGLAFLFLFVIGTFLIYLSTSPWLFSAIISLIVYVIVFYIYLIFAELFKGISKHIFNVPDGDLWDTIYYIIIIIFFLFVIATIVRTIKSMSPQMNLIYSSIGTLYILLIYSVIYFLRKNYERIWSIFFWLNVITLPFTFVLWLIGVPEWRVTKYLYFLFSLLSLVYVITLFICIYKLFDKLYKSYI